MNLFKRYFTAQIDRALDRGVPPTGLTAWYVRRCPELRNDYERMLEMELELRFTETEPENGVEIRPSISTSLNKSPHTPQHTAAAKSIRHVPLAVAVMLFLAFGVTVTLSLPKTPSQPTPVSSALRTVDEEPTIDLAALFPASSMDLSFKPSEPSESDLPLDDTVASFVHFTRQPLESTLTLLESARVITRQPVEN